MKYTLANLRGRMDSEMGMKVEVELELEMEVVGFRFVGFFFLEDFSMRASC